MERAFGASTSDGSSSLLGRLTRFDTGHTEPSVPEKYAANQVQNDRRQTEYDSSDHEEIDAFAKRNVGVRGQGHFERDRNAKAHDNDRDKRNKQGRLLHSWKGHP